MLMGIEAGAIIEHRRFAVKRNLAQTWRTNKAPSASIRARRLSRPTDHGESAWEDEDPGIVGGHAVADKLGLESQHVTHMVCTAALPFKACPSTG
jgi:hypothetical protein